MTVKLSNVCIKIYKVLRNAYWPILYEYIVILAVQRFRPT